MKLKPLTKAVIYALAEMRLGRRALGLGLFLDVGRGLVLR
jgi:hypothetical protein